VRSRSTRIGADGNAAVSCLYSVESCEADDEENSFATFETLNGPSVVSNHGGKYAVLALFWKTFVRP
jgi:hypothetical protein